MRRANSLARFFARLLSISILGRQLTTSSSSTRPPRDIRNGWRTSAFKRQRLFDREERLIFVQGWNSAGAEEPFGWDRRYGYGYLNATAQALKSTAARREMSPLKVAVTVHAYYPELWPEISDLLKPWDSAFGLYVTVPAHADASFAEAIRAEWPQAIVAPVENRGRDMAPFLAMAARAIDDGHSLICKVHTKKSPHLGRGHFWRRDMLRKLLGTVSVEQIQHSFRQNAALGIIAPQGHVLSGTHQFRLNKRHLTELLKKLGHDEDPLPFVFSAGSMFWIRADAMRPLLNLQLRPTDFEAERGQLDGTLAHALERLFPLAARLQGYRTADTRVVGKTFRPVKFAIGVGTCGLRVVVRRLLVMERERQTFSDHIQRARSEYASCAWISQNCQS